MSAQPASPRRSWWPAIGCGVLVLFVGSQVLVLWTSDLGPPAKPSKAQLQCQNLEKPIKVYCERPENKQQVLPTVPSDLHTPPWGGSSLLDNDEHDLIDPWGQRFTFERRARADGTPITEFGIGPNAEPRK